MSDAQDWLTFALAVGAVVSLVAGWLRWVRPRYRRARAEVTGIRDSILGRDAIVDSITGREIEPALPGVGLRLAAQEERLGTLAEAFASLANSHAMLDDHETRIQALEVASVERIVSRAESAAGWRAMEEAIKAEPDADGTV